MRIKTHTALKVNVEPPFLKSGRKTLAVFSVSTVGLTASSCAARVILAGGRRAKRGQATAEYPHYHPAS